MKTRQNIGTLYIVATPIGNLSDISQRVREVLANVDLLACEDTRHTGRLLAYLGIKADLTSYHRDNERQKTEYLVKKLCSGLDIALVSDAGTPGLSDPGAVLVRTARQADIPVVPIPGPSALATALSVSGMEGSGFYFGGFPASKKGERRKQFIALKPFTCSIVLYESPHRIQATLRDCLQIFGDRQAQLFRELTKLHEEHLAGSFSELLELTKGRVRGELVLIISGHAEQREDRPDNLDELICWYRDNGGASLKDAVRLIAEDLDLSRSKVYQQALSVWHDG
ncbi:MAG: 16S rRNA (cytidine(1402)-2'-O)-methyltransferase [Candidatus Electrothrix sp. AR4]|nr:16S rRNA (cytidine(1402)-2'-O)-methyltransferase [Candidatus Electrothrix sp. AR4]